MKVLEDAMAILTRPAVPKYPIALGVSSTMADVLKATAAKLDAGAVPTVQTLIPTSLFDLWYGMKLVIDNRLTGMQSRQIFTDAELKAYVKEIEESLAR